MSNTATKIEWCDTTWNPVTGCQKVSDGCKNCYAERVFNRMEANPKTPAYHGRKFTDVQCHEDKLNEPLHWKKPRRVFVNSMSDLFHKDVSDGWILRIFDIMRRCQQHTFKILTKRPERMKQWFERFSDLEGEPIEPQLVRGPEETRKAHPSGRGQMFAEYLETLGACPPDGCAWPTFDWMGGMQRWPQEPTWIWPNVWLGVSVEDQATADERIPILLQTPAAVRFVSYEPALGPITFRPKAGNTEEILRAHMMDDLKYYQSPAMLHGIDWVIAGGESGPNARPSHPEWFRSVRDQCQAAGVPFFFKQWGEWVFSDHYKRGMALPVEERYFYEIDREHTFLRLGKKHAGRLLDGREWNEFPGGEKCVGLQTKK